MLVHKKYDDVVATVEEGPRATMNVCNAGLNIALLRELVRNNNWLVVEEPDTTAGVDIYWLHTLDKIYWEEARRLIMEQPLVFNLMPGFNVAGTKRSLAKIFNRLRVFNEAEFDFVPKSFLLPKDADALEMYMGKADKTFICKRRDRTEADGLLLVQKFNDLAPKVANSADYVIQEYIDEPLLIEGKKFDVRIYVLVTDLGDVNGQPVLSFISDEALIRFCTESYEKPNA